MVEAADVIDPDRYDWLAGNWRSVWPEALDGRYAPEVVGSTFVVLLQPRSASGRQVMVFQMAQFLGTRESGPAMLIDELWCEPTGAELIGWLEPQPTRLRLVEAGADHLTFAGDAGRFPSRVEYRRRDGGVEVFRQGPLAGESVAYEWHYEPLPPPPWAESVDSG